MNKDTCPICIIVVFNQNGSLYKSFDLINCAIMLRIDASAKKKSIYVKSNCACGNSDIWLVDGSCVWANDCVFSAMASYDCLSTSAIGA